MRLLNKYISTELFAICLVFGLMMGCSSQSDQKKEAKLVYVNWAEGIAYTNLAKAVLENEMGYEVEITSAGVGPAYTAVANGDQDAFMETWLPVLHADYYEQFIEDIVDLGVVYEGTQSGLVVPKYVTIDSISVVPKYVTIDSISQLNSVKAKFDSEITGIDAGAGVMKTTNKVMESYNLDYDLISSSGPAMTSALQKAYENEEWIVVTGWKPHWMFGRFDLKFLKQSPDKKMWKKGDIHIMGRKNIKEDKPELAAFLSNMKLTDSQLADLMAAFLSNMKLTDSQLADLMVKIKNNEDKDKLAVAKEWMSNNQDVVKSWVPKSDSYASK